MTNPERRPPLAQPSSERSMDQSTPNSNRLTTERPDLEPNRRREDDGDDKGEQDVVARTDEGQSETPRQYDEDADGVMPTTDPSLGTKI